MNVGDEARLGVRGCVEADRIAEVERPDQRIHRHAVAIAETVAEVD